MSQIYRRVESGKYEARKIAVAVLGRPLKKEELVHHIDGDQGNNLHNNLVICPDSAYHRLIHQRQDALEACGNPDYRRCVLCRIWDSQDNLRWDTGHGYYHRDCSCKYRRALDHGFTLTTWRATKVKHE